MRWIDSIVFPGFFALWVSTSAIANDLLVPSQYKTIQSAMNAAQAYDRILVGPGKYREQIFFKGIPVTLQSVDGARFTIIDAGGKGPVVTFDSRDGMFTILKGFTLTGGQVKASTARGAGISCLDASPTILDNIICDNRTTGNTASQGGGMYCSGQPLVMNNEFRDNMAVGMEKNTDHGGGGVYALGGLFISNDFNGNSLVSGRNVSDKVYVSKGGGAVLGGKTVFIGNTVTGNNTCFFGQDALGGGLFLMDTPEVFNNVIRSNTARGTYGRGGGIYCEKGSKPKISCNIIVGNYAQSEERLEGQGGGMFCKSGSAPLFTYNTLHANRVGGASGKGGGVMASGASPRIIGCIFWDNTFWKEGKDQKISSFSGVVSSAISYSLIGDGQFVGVNNNFSSDPGFLDAYHLGGMSPCVDAGEPGTSPTCDPTSDLDGSPRILDGTGTGKGRIDVGADEYGVLRRTRRNIVRPGDRVPMILDVPRQSSKIYICAASMGNQGIPLPPPDTRIIPLSVDSLFMQSVGRVHPPFRNFSGVLDGKGAGSLQMDMPIDPNLVGVTIHVAGIVLDSQAIHLVTNSVSVDIQK